MAMPVGRAAARASAKGRPVIAPTRGILPFTVICLALLYAGLSQGNNMAYLILFLLLGLMVASVLSGWKNLQGITVDVLPPEPMMASDTGDVRLRVRHLKGADKIGLWFDLRLDHRRRRKWELPRTRLGWLQAGSAVEVHMAVNLASRGIYDLESVRVLTAYPLGIWRVSSRTKISAGRLVVWPRPEGSAEFPEARAWHGTEGEGPFAEGGEDFQGHHVYRAGESYRHIDWKAVARGQQTLVKEFGGAEPGLVWLNYEVTPQADVEAKISQLAAWVMEAKERGITHALKLPGTLVLPGHGARHFEKCMEALAGWNPEP